MKPFVAMVTAVIGATGAVIACGWALHSCQQRYWESSFKGPYAGAPYTAGITTAPISVLRMPRGGQLEVHESAALSSAVVLLRSPSNDIQWARILVPERKLHDGAVETTWVRDLRLKRVQLGLGRSGRRYHLPRSCREFSKVCLILVSGRLRTCPMTTAAASDGTVATE